MPSSNAYLVLYMFGHFITAIPMSSVGALIPFMAADAGIDETDYSIIFVMISVSTLIAAILYKVLGVYKLLLKHHTILIISCLEMVIFSVVMVYMKTKIAQCIALSILKFFNYYFVVSAYICTMIAPPKEEVGLWMSFSHGAFGFGALAGPIIVGFLGQKMYFVVAAACLIITPFFYFMQSPQDIQKTAQEQAEHDKSKPCSDKLGVLMCICVFILIGIEATIQGWIPTFAVLTHVASKEHAVQFTSIFWTLESICRFIFGYINAPDSRKFTASTWGQLLVGIIGAVLTVMHLPMASAYLSSLYGVTLAMMMPLMMSVPYEFGMHFTRDQISNMMISNTISVGVYSTLTGELMKISPDMYHYSLLAYSALILVFFLWIMAILREQGTPQVTQEKRFEQISPLEEIA